MNVLEFLENISKNTFKELKLVVFRLLYLPFLAIRKLPFFVTKMQNFWNPQGETDEMIDRIMVLLCAN